jgi:D-glycero-alpha-D-manno-heptose-7-phosphate kinase
MLIGRAPLRIGLGGGGTDLAAYYEDFGGMVVNATINKYIYSIVKENRVSRRQVISSDYRAVSHLDDWDSMDDELKLARTVLEQFPELPGADLFLASEVPPGTGLGSSGAVATNLAKVLSVACERPLNRADAAELAYHVEVELLGAPVGKQDQYAAAFGGINCIFFEGKGVRVEPLDVAPTVLQELESNLLLFFTGNARSAWDILERQRHSTTTRRPIVVNALHEIKALCVAIRNALETGDLQEFGRLLDVSWEMKKSLASGVSTGDIDVAYDAAKNAGALGGKITGAGGGGFLVIYCESEAQPAVKNALGHLGLRELHFEFEFQGASVLLNTGLRERKAVGASW